MTHWLIYILIIWLALRAGKMNQIARCDWLPERARLSHLAHSGLPAVSRKQNFPKSHIINPLRLVFTSDGVVVGVVIRRIERYDLVKIKLSESEAEH